MKDKKTAIKVKKSHLYLLFAELNQIRYFYLHKGSKFQLTQYI